MKFLIISLSLISFDLFAQAAGQKFTESSLRQHCHQFEILRRRNAHLLSRYEQLSERVDENLAATPYNRSSVRSELEESKRRVETEIAIISRDGQRLKEQQVRNGCPLSNNQISDQRVRNLFEQAAMQGVFVDDHLLKVEDYSLGFGGF